MFARYCLLIVLSVLIAGCAVKEHPPVSIDAAKQVKSGTPLEEVVAMLGEPHPPTATQADQLNKVVANMPAAIRSNAEGDESLAWGNDDAFLVVKVNDKGTVWVTAWHSH